MEIYVGQLWKKDDEDDLIVEVVACSDSLVYYSVYLHNGVRQYKSNTFKKTDPNTFRSLYSLYQQ